MHRSGVSSGSSGGCVMCGGPAAIQAPPPSEVGIRDSMTCASLHAIENVGCRETTGKCRYGSNASIARLKGGWLEKDRLP